MTRFARAHGSKASNERQPEDATSWNVLKQQLLEQQAATKSKLEEVTKPAKQHFVFQTDKSKTIEWAEFEETPNPKREKVAKKEKKLKFTEEFVDRPGLADKEHHSSKTKLHQTDKRSNVHTDKKLTKKLKQIKENKLKNLHSEDLGTVLLKDEIEFKVSKREKRNNKLKVSKKPIEKLSPNSQETNSELRITESVDGSERQLSKRQLKRKKHLLKKQQDDGFVFKPKLEEVNEKKIKTSINGNVNGDDLKLSKRQKDKRRSQLKKQQSSTLISTSSNEATVTTDNHTKSDIKFQAQSKRQKRNLKKLGDPLQVKQRRRRKPLVQTTTMLINGQEIEVTMLDGFPVRKQDADRLKELRKQMVDNGIPPTEIEETMKLERRKAEKALARERRKVCFHCRKGGHNLSECPELNEGSNQDAAGSGICFKCGSTEHTHFECRVVRGQEFRFAKCFICQEQGHISRQCPDNPRGLYPKGGGCKVCGDVTHLKKDCPDLHEKKEQNIITLDTARSDQLEALDEELKMEVSRPVVSAPKNKIIKF